MPENIDKIDRQILSLLQRDASISVDVLAEQVHLSRNACWRRVKNLEASKVILRRVAILDPETVGLGLLVMVLVRTNQHDSNWLKLFHDAVRHMPEIISAHRMSGELDYVLRVRVATVRDYDMFYQRLISRVPVADISASFVMEDIKDTTELPV
jgi:Lrp/AsnC family transcriptional regulator